MGTLPPEWKQYLADRGVWAEAIQARGYKVVYSGKALDGDYASAYGFPQTHGGLLIPLHLLLGGEAYQLRFTPGTEPKDKNGKPRKFATPKGQLNVLSTSPLTRDLLRSAKEAIVIAEGVTRVDALVSYGIPAVAITGSASWRGKNAQGGVTSLPDFENLAIKGNRFILAFDGDVTTNSNVNASARRLAAFLDAKGADSVWTLTLPDGVGLDDWIAANRFPDKKALAAALQEHSTQNLGKAPRDVKVPTPTGRLFAIDDASWRALSPPGRRAPPAALPSEGRVRGASLGPVGPVVASGGGQRRTMVQARCR